MIGNLVFRDNKLSLINKDWGNFYGAQAVSLGKVLYNCISKQKGNVFNIHTNFESDPKGEIRRISIWFNEDGKTKSLSIDIYERMEK